MNMQWSYNDNRVRYDRRNTSGYSTNQSPAARYPVTYPTTKSKDVVCVLCKKKFLLGRDWRAKCPLLLPCGHASCSECETTTTEKMQCPLCPPCSAESRKQLPINNYVYGLINVINAKPPYCEDPDMTFVSNEVRTIESFDAGCSNECGSIATLRCDQCNILVCKHCFKQIHRAALQSHTAILINKNVADLITSNFCPNHELEGSSYYCVDCDYECCSHCIIQTHKNHNTVLQKDRNEEFKDKLDNTSKKLLETRARIQLTQKRLNEKKASFKASKQLQVVEDKITQHFIHLHGVMQNVEQELKEKLLQHRASLTRDIESSEQELENSGKKLKTALSVVKNAMENNEKINLKKLIGKLDELADLPCHVASPEGYDEGYRFEARVDTIVDLIKNNVTLDVPQIPGLTLLKTDELPENYEIETLPSIDMNLLSFNKTCSKRDSLSTTLNSTHSYESSSLSVESLCVFDLPKKEKDNNERVIVTHIVDPLNFYVQRLQNQQQLQETEKQMDIHAKTSEKLYKEMIHLNCLYVVQHPTSLKWWRGRVSECILDPETETPTYNVCFIDYGMTETGIPLESIRESKPEFNCFPGQAVHCALQEIAPMNDEWVEETIDKFKEITRCDLTMSILKVDGDLLTIDLKKWNNNRCFSVHQTLLDCKLAKSVTFHKLKRMNPLSAHQFYFEELPLQKYTTVLVSHVESPNSIFVVKQNQEFKKRKAKFQNDFLHEMAYEDKPVTRPEYGKTVCVFDQRKGMYERGYITEIADSTVNVYQVDSGVTVSLEYSKLKQLRPSYCHTSAQAIKISLADIKPIEGENWSPAVTEYLRKIIGNKRVKVIPFAKIEHNEHYLPEYTACIFKGDTNISAHLVSKKYACSTGKFSANTAYHVDVDVSKKKQKKKSKKNKEIKKTLEVPEKNVQTRKLSERVESNDPFSMRIRIHRVETPELIYASKVTINEDLVQMDKDMKDFYENLDAKEDNLLQIDEHYCVYSRKDKKHCRAKFLGMSESNPELAKVLLIDLAEEEEIPLDKFYHLPSKFAVCHRKLFKIKIAGITPCEGSSSWQSTTCEKLKDIIDESGDSKFYMTLATSESKDEPFPVMIKIKRNVEVGPTEPNKMETIDVRLRLIDEGLALPQRGFVENDARELAIEMMKRLKIGGTKINLEKLQPKSPPDSSEVIDNDPQPVPHSIIETASEDASPASELESSKEDQNADNENDIQPELDISSESWPEPPKICNWIEAEHILEKSLKVTITQVDHEGYIYFHPDTPKYEENLQRIRDKLFNQYENRSIKSYDGFWEVGDLCIARWHHDGKWYRAKVIDTDQAMKVQFVDYGTEDLCQVGSLKKRIMLEDVPIQATRAMIHGVRPITDTKDLDVLHTLLVEKNTRVKIVQKPPKTWVVAVWLTEGQNEYYLPWYLRNKTNIKCDIEDNDLYYADSDDDDESKEETNFKKNILLTKPLSPVVIKDDSSSTEVVSSDDEYSDSSFEIDVIDPDTLVDSAKTENGSETLRYENFTFKSKSQLNLSTNLADSPSSSTKSHSKSSAVSSSKSSTVSSSAESLRDGNRNSNATNPEYLYGSSYYDNGITDLGNKIFEKMISGNSPDAINHNDSFETQSIKIDSLNEEILHTSTPMNSSFQDYYFNDYIDEDYHTVTPERVDFKKWNFKTFKINIGAIHSLRQVYGSIESVPDLELNTWIYTVKQEMLEEIQQCALKQPICRKLHKGTFCIAKFEDGKWYRAQIKSYDDRDNVPSIKVYFIDYGNSHDIKDINEVRVAKKEWLSIPELSFEFEFANLNPIPGFEKQVNRLINDSLHGIENFYAVIKKYKPKLELELYLDKDCQQLAYQQVIDSNLLQNRQ